MEKRSSFRIDDFFSLANVRRRVRSGNFIFYLYIFILFNKKQKCNFFAFSTRQLILFLSCFFQRMKGQGNQGNFTFYFYANGDKIFFIKNIIWIDVKRKKKFSCGRRLCSILYLSSFRHPVFWDNESLLLFLLPRFYCFDK